MMKTNFQPCAKYQSAVLKMIAEKLRTQCVYGYDITIDETNARTSLPMAYAMVRATWEDAYEDRYGEVTYKYPSDVVHVFFDPDTFALQRIEMRHAYTNDIIHHELIMDIEVEARAMTAEYLAPEIKENHMTF